MKLKTWHAGVFYLVIDDNMLIKRSQGRDIDISKSKLWLRGKAWSWPWCCHRGDACSGDSGRDCCHGNHSCLWLRGTNCLMCGKNRFVHRQLWLQSGKSGDVFKVISRLQVLVTLNNVIIQWTCLPVSRTAHFQYIKKKNSKEIF